MPQPGDELRVRDVAIEKRPVWQMRGARTGDEEMDRLYAKRSAQLASELERDDRAHAVSEECERDVQQRRERTGQSLDQTAGTRYERAR